MTFSYTGDERLAITEMRNSRREKSGEEKFDIIVPAGRKSALGDQMVTILREAYEKAVSSSNPFLKIPADENVTRVALVILVAMGFLISPHKKLGQKREYVITQTGMDIVAYHFPIPIK